MPPRRVPLSPGDKPLTRRLPLQRGGGLPGVPIAPRRKATGFPVAVRRMALKRAGGGDMDAARCEACGSPPNRLEAGFPDVLDFQHRLARGMGGCTSEVVNGITNCGVLCRPCHDACEARDPEMEARGWWIRSGNGPEHDPRFVRVWLASQDGPVAVVYLSGSGGYATEPPGEVAA